MAIAMLMAEVSVGRVRSRPRLGWMDGVSCAKDGEWKEGVESSLLQSHAYACD